MPHTPGRGHRRKSDPHKKKRFQKKAQRRKIEAQKAYENAKRLWDSFTEEVRKIRTDLDPEKFKR
jgi:hypothetical protein